MPLNNPILNMFARSPIRPIEKHMLQAHACAELLIPFFQASEKEDWEEARTVRNQICEAEHRADELKMEVRLHMPQKVMLPVPRHDLLELIAKQDKIANVAKDISGIVLGRKMVIPPQIRASFSIYLGRCIDASAQAAKAISELDELLEAGFRGKVVDIVVAMIKELNTIESETDAMQVTLREELFQIEKQLQPIDVMFLYQIIEWVGTLADCAQKAGSRLQMLTAD